MDKRIIYYMYSYDTCAKIEVCYPGDIINGPSILVENYSDEWYKLPFGKKDTKPTYRDFLRMLEKRCFPKERYNCRQLLQDAGLDYYNPLDIVKKTHGVMADDLFWIRFEGEGPELWDTINPRLR